MSVVPVSSPNRGRIGEEQICPWYRDSGPNRGKIERNLYTDPDIAHFVLLSVTYNPYTFLDRMTSMQFYTFWSDLQHP